MATAITVTVDAVDYVFTPESVSSEAVRFRITGSTLAVPRYCEIARVLPKRTKTFPGVARNSVNLHWNLEYGTDEVYVQPIVLKQSSSRRADTESADYLLARKVFNGLLADSQMDSFYAELEL
jgi:hypothetical protein